MKVQQTIGIVGGGQLGRMLTLAALPLGFRVIVVDPSPNCPAAQAGAVEITADLYNKDALTQLASQVDYITVEIEHIDTDVLTEILQNGTPVNPAPKTIKLIQDKLAQKQALRAADIAVADFVEINDSADAIKALTDFNGKMLIKTRYGGYDGRGNIVVNSAAEVRKALQFFAGKQLYAEAYVSFRKELAVMVARSMQGDIAVYPVVETIQKRNICLEVLVPAQINSQAHKRALSLARQVAAMLEGAGSYGIEMFLGTNNQVLINEIAPRVHNSGHYTIEANRTSQFEQHIRAISGLPLGSTELMMPAAAMVNILGERDGPVALSGLAGALSVPHTSVHLYGKSPTKVDRKMGHITSTAKTVIQARTRARRARGLLKI